MRNATDRSIARCGPLSTLHCGAATLQSVIMRPRVLLRGQRAMHSLGHIIERLETRRALDRVHTTGREGPRWPVPPVEELENPYGRYPMVTMICLTAFIGVVILSLIAAALSAARIVTRPARGIPAGRPAKAAPLSNAPSPP